MQTLFFYCYRFELLPTISADPHEGSGDSSQKNSVSLSRSVSQPAIFPPRPSQVAKLKSVDKHEDDLDIIHQIIETDETTLPHESAGQITDAHGRSLSLSHINDFSSLPIIPNDKSIHHVLKANYFSAPDFSRLESPPSYECSMGLKQEPSRPLTHESRSSSLGDCQAAAACDHVNEHATFSTFDIRRNSRQNSLSTSLGDIHEQRFEGAPPCDVDVPLHSHPILDLHHTSGGGGGGGLDNILREGMFEDPAPFKNRGRLETILSLRLGHQHGSNGRFSAPGDAKTPTGNLSICSQRKSDNRPCTSACIIIGHIRDQCITVMHSCWPPLICSSKHVP